jgi:hypothetical protein
MEDREASSAYGMGLEEVRPSRSCGAAIVRAHRAQLTENRTRIGIVAGAPRVDVGPGLPATACRKCRTAATHDELAPCTLLRRNGYDAQCSALKRDAAPSVFRSAFATAAGCAYAVAHPALTQVVSKKAKAASSIPRQRFPRLSRVGKVRNREDVANLRAILRLRSTRNCAGGVLHELSHYRDC